MCIRDRLRLRRDPRRLTPTIIVSAAAAIWIVIKLPQEYWLHIARLDLTDVLKTALFGAPPETPWGHIFRAAPWLYAGVAILGVGVVVGLAVLAGRGQPPTPQTTPNSPTSVSYTHLDVYKRQGRPHHPAPQRRCALEASGPIR